jgi:DNA-binding NarL/FixJ family response regulator
VDDARMRRMAAAGAAATLQKPISSDELQRVLTRMARKVLTVPPERRKTAPLLRSQSETRARARSTSKLDGAP